MSSTATWRAGVVFAAVLLGCEDGDGGGDGGIEELPVGELDCSVPAPAQATCARVGAVVPLWRAPHPGGGAEAVVRLVDACTGNALPTAYGACLVRAGDVETAPRVLGPGNLMILAAAPRSDAEGAATLEALDALLAARPAGEAIALHRVGATVDQVADFTQDFQRIRLLAAEAFAPGTDAGQGSLADAITNARGLVEAIGGPSELSFRSVIVISAEAPPTEAVAPRAAALAWVPAGSGAADAARAASAALDQMAAAGAVGLGTCGRRTLDLRFAKTRTTSIALTPPLPEENRLTCDAAAAARGDRPYPRRIEFVFTPDERRVHDDLYERHSKRDFNVSVRLGDADPIPATAHLRGHGSMKYCVRKGYSVNLEAQGPRPIMPGSVDDEFLLISLCYDQAYVESYTFDQLLSARGFWPLKFDYVELVIDGESHGVFMLMEKPHEAAKRDHARALGQIRRNHEIESDPLGVKIFKDGAEWIVQEYEDLLPTAENTSGEEMVAELRRRMAFDHYLRFVATMTALMNSDYGDEVRFLATERIGSPGALWEISAWDPEDMLRLTCVWDAYTLHDPTGLVWCAEGWLEQEVLADPVAHRMYAEILRAVLADLTVERFDEALANARARLAPFMQDPAIRAASIEMGSPATADEALAKIDSRQRTMRKRFVAWHDELQRRLAAYNP